MSETEDNATGPRQVGVPKEQADGERAERKSTRYLTTLDEQKAKLPVGILDGTTVHRDVVFKKWRTKEERELGRLMAPDMDMAEHVSLVVSNMCSRIGHHNMDEKDAAEKALIVSMMYMGDVFYTYSMLRKRVVGDALDVKVACPRAGCGVTFPYSGKLGTLEVACVDNIDDILWTHKLSVPIEIRKETVTHFDLAYPKWSVVEAGKGETSEAEIKALTLVGTIVGINGNGQAMSPLAMEELDELERDDFEAMMAGINENFLGPKMGVEGQCTPDVCKKFKRGGHDFAFSIDWRYKHFFARSSP